MDFRSSSGGILVAFSSPCCHLTNIVILSLVLCLTHRNIPLPPPTHPSSSPETSFPHLSSGLRHLLPPSPCEQGQSAARSLNPDWKLNHPRLRCFQWKEPFYGANSPSWVGVMSRDSTVRSLFLLIGHLQSPPAGLPGSRTSPRSWP